MYNVGDHEDNGDNIYDDYVGDPDDSDAVYDDQGGDFDYGDDQGDDCCDDEIIVTTVRQIYCCIIETLLINDQRP